MSRISVTITIENASDAVLRLVSSKLDHGEWTTGKKAPTTIGRSTTVSFRSEGDMFLTEPLTGTEGRVYYTINFPGNSGELYIHWNSPLVESQYGNTYGIRCPAGGWEVSQSGGQGHNAGLHIRLRRSMVRRVPNFDPRGRGFAFSNTTWNSDLPAVKLGFVLKTLYSNDACIGKAASRVLMDTINLATAGVAPIVVAAISDDFGPTLTNAGSGLCGGMTFTVMDYYYAHMLPPVVAESPKSEEDSLFRYIRQRQMESFDFNGDGCRYLVYSLPTYPHGDEGFVQAVGLWKGRSWVTYREAWPQIQADIDAGKLSPLGLIRTDSGDLANNHQVLAYGYRRSGQDVTLYILDPNKPQKEMMYEFNITDTTVGVHISQKVNGVVDNSNRIYCFFRMNNYSPQTPPNGRHFISLRDAILATVGKLPQTNLSTRSAMVNGASQNSVLTWLRAL